MAVSTNICSLIDFYFFPWMFLFPTRCRSANQGSSGMRLHTFLLKWKCHEHQVKTQRWMCIWGNTNHSLFSKCLRVGAQQWPSNNKSITQSLLVSCSHLAVMFSFLSVIIKKKKIFPPRSQNPPLCLSTPQLTNTWLEKCFQADSTMYYTIYAISLDKSTGALNELEK